jgi:hypothetical protein
MGISFGMEFGGGNAFEGGRFNLTPAALIYTSFAK